MGKINFAHCELLLKCFVTFLVILIRTSETRLSAEDFVFHDNRLYALRADQGDTATPSMPDVTEEESGSAIDGDGTEKDIIVYYRAHLNITSLKYDKRLSRRSSTLFKNLDRPISDAIEAHFKDTPGTQTASVIKFERPKQPMGVLTYVDLKSVGYNDTDAIRDIFSKMISDGRVGTFQVSGDGYMFHTLPEGPDRGDITVVTCRTTEFSCNNGPCIAASKVCDGDKDCPDGSDEVDCHACKANERPCQISTDCYGIHQRCDGNADCIDGSDELNCPKKRDCTDDEFRCSDGKCIPSSLRCNGKFNCSDGSDEHNCPGVKCRESEFRCDDGMCVKNNTRCDGHNDCSDGSDERSCPSGKRCTEGYIRCGDGGCVLKSKICDGVKDCADGSDESIQACGGKVCEADQFACKDGRCILKDLTCNGYPDCDGAEDEENCGCGSNQFQCGDGKCVTKAAVCNLVYDCNDRSDESSCPALELKVIPHSVTVRVGESVVFMCQSNYPGGILPLITWVRTDRQPITSQSVTVRDKLTLSNVALTDAGHYECVSRQHPQAATNSTKLTVLPRCDASQFECVSGQCISLSGRCNNFNECPDGSDEQGCPDIRMTISPKSLRVKVGERAEFRCEASGNNPPGAEWYRVDRQPITSRSIVDRSRLIITSAALSDDGQYECRAAGNRNSIVDRATLSVEKPLTLTITPHVLRVQVGERVEFICRASGPNQPTITWVRVDRRPLSPESRFDGDKYVINTASSSDAGEYQCRAVGIPGAVIGRATLIVDQRTSVKVDPSELLVLIGQDAKFRCTSDATAQVRWNKITGGLPQSAEEVNGELIIRNARKQDEGEYVCSAVGATGTVDARAKLIVEERPSIHVSPESMIVHEGNIAIFQCHHGKSHEIRRVSWKRASGELPPSARVMDDGKLIIPDVKREYGGFYVCSSITFPNTPTASARLIVHGVICYCELHGYDVVV